MANDDEHINIFYFADCYNIDRVDEAMAIYNKTKNSKSVVLGGGDWFGGGALSRFDKGDLMLEVLLDFDVKVSAIGNHEFDHGIPRALELFNRSQDRINWCCSNLKIKDGKGGRPATALPYLAKSGPVTIHETVVLNVGGKKLGVFALLDKNTGDKLDNPDFDKCFELDSDVRSAATRAVASLNAQGVDIVIGISHMDGYYTKAMRDKGDTECSNALDMVIPGLHLLLDASNHEALAGVLYKELFKGSSGLTAERMPGYVMGGVNLNYLNQVTLGRDDITTDFAYHMHNTQHMRIPPTSLSGTLIGPYVNGTAHVPKAFELVSSPGTYVFGAFNDGYFKMATCKLAAAKQAATRPRRRPRPILANKYVDRSPELEGLTKNLTAAIVNQLWEGTYPNLTTRDGKGYRHGKGYRLKDVSVPALSYPKARKLQKKYAELTAKYLKVAGLEYHSVRLAAKFDFSAFRSVQETAFSRFFYTLLKKQCPQMDLMILPSGTVRDSSTYNKGSEFSTANLLAIFAFGAKMVFFEMEAAQVKKFADKFLLFSTGGYPQFHPKQFEQLPKYKAGQKLVCCTNVFQFGGGDGYPFKKEWGLSTFPVKNCGKKNVVDMFSFLNNEDELVSFADPAYWNTGKL